MNLPPIPEIVSEVLAVAGAVSMASTAVGALLGAFGLTKASAIAKTVGIDVSEFLDLVKSLLPSSAPKGPNVL